MQYYPYQGNALPDEYVSLDLETTGLNCRKNEILEIGMIKVRNGKAIEKMQVLVQPRKDEVSPFITSLTGITSDMVRNQPVISEVAPWIWDFVGGRPIVGYNIRFDLRFLAVHAPSPYPVQYIDVYPRCKAAHADLPHCRLSDMTALYSLHQNTHRAVDDALAAAQLYELSRSWKI